MGILKSGLYKFVEGHIYFNNNTIKIRYDLLGCYGDKLARNDLLGSKDTQILKENDVFNYYINIIPQKDGIRMKSFSPLDSLGEHRMIYLNHDTN